MWRNKILWLFVLLCACKRESPTSWNSELLVPIAHGRVTLDHIIPDSLLYADDLGLWHFRFSEELTNFDLDTLVEIPDTVISKSFVVPLTGGPFNIPAGQVIINEAENNLINVNDAMLREVRVKSGFLNYSVKSFIDGYLDCTYQLPGVTLNNVPTIIQTTTQPGTDSQPFVYSGSIDLSGYRINLTGESGFMFNRIFSLLTVTSASNAPGPTLVSGNDSLLIELSFADPVVSYARGYFGQHHYQLNEVIDLSDNVNFPDGLLQIESASMQLNIQNNVGVDAQIDFAEVSNSNQWSAQEVMLQHAPLYNPINITRAYEMGGGISPTSYSLLMNNSNSNITAFLENLPDQLALSGAVTVNPLGDVTDGNDFIYTNKALVANLDVDIPLRIAASGLQLRDTIDVQAISSEFRADGFLELHVENAFPFQATCSLIIAGLESDVVVIDQQAVMSAIPTDQDDVTIPVKSIIRLPVNDVLLGILKSNARMIVGFRLDTPDYDEIHGIYDSYYMDFKLLANGTVVVQYE
jgi:hypothetical protein